MRSIIERNCSRTPSQTQIKSRVLDGVLVSRGSRHGFEYALLETEVQS